jgi:hypothetical protein
MDVATLVLTASVIIILLQIISIVLIVKNGKALSKSNVPVQNHHAHDARDNRKPRDDSRFNNRRGGNQDQRPRPEAPKQPQAVDYVEKSLRDINLRLKNAERDQESARKKIKDVVVDGQPNSQNGQRRQELNPNNRPNREGRDGEFRRRDRNRPNNNFRNKDQNQSRPAAEQQASSVDAVPAEIRMPPIPQMPVAIPAVPVAIAPQVAQVERESTPAVVDNAEVFHGRKALVRRRILTAEEQAAAGAANNPATAPVVTEAAASQTITQQPDSGRSDADVSPPISFGR